MYGLDLFSGIGGLTKALDGYVRPIAYCEIDPYVRGVLLSRMYRGELPIAPIWDDVTTLHGTDLPYRPDIIYGGFPCQDISVIGKQIGLGGERSGLFFEIIRLAGETKVEWIFLENVSNIRTKGLGRVLKELESGGYDCRWGLLSAADVGANHKRERWFLLAHRRRERLEGYAGNGPYSARRQESCRSVGTSGLCTDGDYSGWWKFEPNVGRVAHGIPKRVDRLRALGNAVVPAQAREAFERLMGIKDDK